MVLADKNTKNVAPAWRAMQRIWMWQDNASDPLWQDETHLGELSPSQSHPWWEDVANMVAETEGRMNLS